MSNNQYNQYTKTSYSGRQLLENHNLDEIGKWKILGEDPNCDLGGVHRQPDLGTFTGTLEDAIRYATQLNGFFAWGGGGDIKKLSGIEDVSKFLTDGIREKALSKLTEEEKEVLGLKENKNK